MTDRDAPGPAAPPREPSDRAYSSGEQHGLKRAEFRLARMRVLETTLDRYVGMKMDDRTIVRLRVDVEREVSKAFALEDVGHIPFYVHLESDTVDRSVSLDLTVPLFRHDCRECEFLGRWTDDGAGGGDPDTVDLYTCEKQGYRTFIARYGDDGPDYTSGPSPVTAALNEALRRWSR